MTITLTSEEVQELENTTLNDVEVELFYFLFLESQNQQGAAL